MDKTREMKEELKKTSAGRVFLEEAEQEKHTDKMIEFAIEHCDIFQEDSYMGKYLRETLKILQESPCEDAVSREDVIKAIDRHTFNTDDGLCLDEDITIILEELPPVTPVQRWIHVSEEYPNIEDEYKYFLVTDENGKVSVQKFLLSLDEEPQPYFSGMVNVIAWMPLPKPYKTETENEV